MPTCGVTEGPTNIPSSRNRTRRPERSSGSHLPTSALRSSALDAEHDSNASSSTAAKARRPGTCHTSPSKLDDAASVGAKADDALTFESEHITGGARKSVNVWGRSHLQSAQDGRRGSHRC